MLQLVTRYRGLIVVGALLALPLVLLYAQTKKPGARGPVVGVFVDVAALLERGLLWSVGSIVDGFDHYFTSVASYDELVHLRRDRSGMLKAQTRIAELETENDELRALLREVERIDGPRPIAARVVARTGAPLTRLFTLDVGTADGVRRGDGVVDRNGVVGLVLAVGRRSCDVLLLSDSSSALDVIDQRTRARGIIRGEGSDERYGAKVEDFDKLRDVKPGDLVVTSGLGARFPVGVPVGTVTDAVAPDDSLYLRAVVRPAAELDRVEHVAVLIDRPPPMAPRLGGHEDEDVDGAPVDAGPAPEPAAPKHRRAPPAPAKPPAAAPSAAPAPPTPGGALKPDAGAPKPDAGAPKAGAPEPDAGAPKPGAPKTGAPKPGAPKTGAPKAGAPKAGAPKPGAPRPAAAKTGDAGPR